MVFNPIDFVKNSFVTKSKKNLNLSLSLCLFVCLFFLSIKEKKPSRILNTLYSYMLTYACCTSNLKKKNYNSKFINMLMFSSFKTLQVTKIYIKTLTGWQGCCVWVFWGTVSIFITKLG